MQSNMSISQDLSASVQMLGFDDPTKRLLWTVPSALLIWIIIVGLLAGGLKDSTPSIPQPSEMQAELVEEAEAPKPAPRLAAAQASPKLAAVAAVSPITTVTPVTPATPPVQGLPPQATPSVKSASSADSGLPTPTPTSKSNSEQSANTSTLPGSGLGNQSAARALLQPMPHIPESLREEALQAQAVARFSIGVDGVVTVEWVKPTQNTVLNRLLLDTLKNWKFFPEIKDGKPIASTQEIVIKVDLK